MAVTRAWAAFKAGLARPAGAGLATFAVVWALAWCTAPGDPRPVAAGSLDVPPPASAAELEQRLAADTTWQATDLRFPGAIHQAAEAAWAADEAGRPGVARRAMQGFVTTALATAPDPLLLQHADLMRLKFAAVADGGPLVCQGLLDGSLDLAAVLPAQTVQADATFKILLMSTPPRRGRPLPRGTAHRALQPVLLSLGPAQVEALGNPRRSARLRCEAYSGFYAALARLPLDARRLALRAALQ